MHVWQTYVLFAYGTRYSHEQDAHLFVSLYLVASSCSPCLFLYSSWFFKRGNLVDRSLSRMPVQLWRVGRHNHRNVIELDYTLMDILDFRLSL